MPSAGAGFDAAREADVDRFLRELEAWRRADGEVDVWRLLATADLAIARLYRLAGRVGAAGVS